LKILIIGANGQVGHSLKKFLKKSYKLKAIAREDVDCSEIQEVEKFFSKNVYDLIINAVAYTNVDAAEKEIDLAYKLNENFPYELAKISKSTNATLIHFSTDYVFDGKKQDSYIESDQTIPINVYGKSKLKGEKAIIENCSRYFIFRTSWVMGEHGDNFIKKIINLAKNKNELKVVNDQYGVPTSVNLINRVIFSLIQNLKYKKNWPYGIYHLSPRGKTTWYQLTNFFFDIVKIEKLNFQISKNNIVPINSSEFKTLATRPKNSLLNTDKIQKYLEFSLPNWKDDFKELINKIIKNL